MKLSSPFKTLLLTNSMSQYATGPKQSMGWNPRRKNSWNPRRKNSLVIFVLCLLINNRQQFHKCMPYYMSKVFYTVLSSYRTVWVKCMILWLKQALVEKLIAAFLYLFLVINNNAFVCIKHRVKTMWLICDFHLVFNIIIIFFLITFSLLYQNPSKMVWHYRMSCLICRLV